MKREIKFRAWVAKSVEMIYEGWNGDMFYSKREIFAQGEDAEIMQFTGDKDVTGKESYEGDIVENENGDKRLIKWAVTGFEMRLLDGSRDKTNNTIWWFKYTNIGNIYENPELTTP